MRKTGEPNLAGRAEVIRNLSFRFHSFRQLPDHSSFRQVSPSDLFASIRVIRGLIRLVGLRSKISLNTYPKILLAFVLAGALGGIGPSIASADVINPVKDNTLYEYVPVDGDLSNGVGIHFFAGKTGEGHIRRGVLAFDIAGSIPPGSTITSVSLSLHMSRTRLDPARTVELHKLLADWGEGT